MKVTPLTLWSDFDIDLFKVGKHYHLYEKMGAHVMTHEQTDGCYFCVYAPAADLVQLMGDFNDWQSDDYDLIPRTDGSGLWEGFIPGVGKGDLYKYKIRNAHSQIYFEKADPFARYAEHPPKTASVVWDDRFKWRDQQWLNQRASRNSLEAPFSIYEVHLGSWRKKHDHSPLSYIDLATELVTYVKQMGFTHVELMPIMEHPYDPSWGYQVTSYFAPTSRYGDPKMFKFLVEAFHKQNIGVILDWVPAHFPSDEFALANFDGSQVYEHPDRRKGFHPDWNSLIFNYERAEVRSFLISSAMFWLSEYHIDGLRVDAVASMIYLDYSRDEGAWEPNIDGGNEYLDAISLVKDGNSALYKEHPHIQMIAEESTAFPMVTKPVDQGGLGFGMKWMMGWMNDTLDYFSRDPIYRKFHQNDLTFSMMYAYSEQYVLPFSHDEVVHGKGSLLGKMPGDEWQKFANLRCMYAYMWSHPGNKLFFMGSELASYNEWDFNGQLEWGLLQYKPHRGIQKLVHQLNTIFTQFKAMYECNLRQEGFQWVDIQDAEKSVLSYLRKGTSAQDQLLVVANFSLSPYDAYRIGCTKHKAWNCILNTDDGDFYGSDYLKGKQKKKIKTENVAQHGFEQSVKLDIPPMSMMFFVPV